MTDGAACQNIDTCMVRDWLKTDKRSAAPSPIVAMDKPKKCSGANTLTVPTFTITVKLCAALRAKPMTRLIWSVLVVLKI